MAVCQPLYRKWPVSNLALIGQEQFTAGIIFGQDFERFALFFFFFFAKNLTAIS